DIIREVVYVEGGETRTRLFHRRALGTLQEVSVPPAKLAYHAVSAGLLEPAFRLSVAAGDEAIAVFALHDAIEHYEQAWRLLTEQPGRYAMPRRLADSWGARIGGGPKHRRNRPHCPEPGRAGLRQDATGRMGGGRATGHGGARTL